MICEECHGLGTVGLAAGTTTPGIVIGLCTVCRGTGLQPRPNEGRRRPAKLPPKRPDRAEIA